RVGRGVLISSDRARPGGTESSMSTEITAQMRIGLKSGAQATQITLNNPPLNVIDIPMMEELAAALEEINTHPEISTILFRGEGNCFSAGVDVRAHTPDRFTLMLEKFHTVIRALVATRKI